MKTAIVLMLSAALFAGNALAQGSPLAGKPGMAMMDMDKQSAQMQERMKTMQAQMEHIHKITDPAERRKLMQEHMQSMREGVLGFMPISPHPPSVELRIKRPSEAVPRSFRWELR